MFESIVDAEMDIQGLVVQPDAAGSVFSGEKHLGIRNARDLEAIVGRMLRPHRLEFETNSDALNAELFMLKGRGVSLLIHKYGETVQIVPQGEGRFLLVDMPLAGYARYWIGREEIAGNAGQAAILPSDHPLRVQFNKGLQQIIVRIEWDRVELACERYFGVSAVADLRFDPRLERTSPSGKAWYGAVQSLIAFSQYSSAFRQASAYAAQIEDLMIGALLLGHPNTYSDDFNSASKVRNAVMPRYIKRAVEYLHEHAGDAITISEVALAVGVSHAALAARFREVMQQTPSEYLRSIRLGRVHAELLASRDSNGNLTELALKYGFAHYGHFARHYLTRYGEHPRETLRKARAAKARCEP